MPSSDRRHRRAWLAFAVIVLGGAHARAQQAYAPFALERLYPSAPGAGWFGLDALDMSGGLGGVAGLSVSYAHDPLVVNSGGHSLAVVSDMVTVDLGLAVTFGRLRISLATATPLLVSGQSGMLGGIAFTNPSVDPGSAPDVLADPRVAIDARLFGGPRDPFRLGAGVGLMVPAGNGSTGDYVSDGLVRGVLRVDVAGDIGMFVYAAHAGVLLRARDDTPAPDAPRGAELLFGAGGGARFAIPSGGGMAIIVGPELVGATALHAAFDGEATSLEGLLGGRLESTARSGYGVRVKLGAGAGLVTGLGAPEWRVLAGVELFNRNLMASP